MALGGLTTIVSVLVLLYFLTHADHIPGLATMIIRKASNVLFAMTTIVLAGILLRSEKTTEPNHGMHAPPLTAPPHDA